MLGKVLSSREGRAVIGLSSGLGLRDGILAFKEGEGWTPEGRPREPLVFSASGLSDAQSHRSLVTAKAGSLVEIDVPALLAPGTELRRVSDREADRRKVAPEEYEAVIEAIPARLSVEHLEDGFHLSLSLQIPPGPLLREGGRIPIMDPEPLPLEAARTKGGFLKALALFSESGLSDFRLEVLPGDAPVLLGDVEVRMEDLFLPPSLLKRCKNRLYACVEDWFEGSGQEASIRLAQVPDSGMAAFDAPPRRSLCFPSPLLASGMPFLQPSAVEEGLALPQSGGFAWLPLSPLVDDWESYSKAAASIVRDCIEKGGRIAVGIDAFHHLPFARGLCDLDPSGERLAFFGDMHLYCANSRALAFWKKKIPRLLFAYSWLEDGEGTALHGVPGLAEAGQGFEPPLFMSKGCYVRHDLHDGSCPPACRRSYSLPLRERDRRYHVVVDGCITMLFRDSSLTAPGGV